VRFKTTDNFMLNLTKKDCAIIVLFFVLILISSSLPSLIDNSRDLAPSVDLQPPHIALPSAIGFFMSMPLVPVALVTTWLAGTMGASVNVTSHIGLIPWFTAVAYSAILAFILAKYNSLRTKK